MLKIHLFFPLEPVLKKSSTWSNKNIFLPHLLFIIFSLQRLIYQSIKKKKKKRIGSEPNQKERKKTQRVFYGALWILGCGIHVKVVKLCKIKGVSSNRGPAILGEIHWDLWPQKLAIQLAGGEMTLGARKVTLEDIWKWLSRVHFLITCGPPT